MPKPLAITSQEISQCFAEPKIAAEFPPILTIEQAAALFQVSPRTLKLYIAQGLFQRATTKIGRHRRIFRDRAVEIIFSRGHTRPRNQSNQEDTN